MLRDKKEGLERKVRQRRELYKGHTWNSSAELCAIEFNCAQGPRSVPGMQAYSHAQVLFHLIHFRSTRVLHILRSEVTAREIGTSCLPATKVSVKFSSYAPPAQKSLCHAPPQSSL